MIKRLVSVRPKGAKLLEARQSMQEMNEWFNKKYPEIAMETYTERFGNYLTLHSISQFETLADLEKHMSEVNSDEEFQALFMKGADLTVDDSLRVTLMESL
ncbi:MAG: hypothetical protein ISS66_14200 [Desulfobacteraceae bacterium]|nr:hypothetical protein [Desulfobacteraceae bacterium]